MPDMRRHVYLHDDHWRVMQDLATHWGYVYQGRPSVSAMLADLADRKIRIVKGRTYPYSGRTNHDHAIYVKYKQMEG